MENGVDAHAMDIDEDRIKPMILAIKANAYKSIGLAFPFSKGNQGIMLLKKEVFVDKTLELLGNHLMVNVWNIRISILKAIDNILGKIDSSIELKKQTLEIVMGGLFASLEEAKVSNLLKTVLNCTRKRISLFFDIHWSDKEAPIIL